MAEDHIILLPTAEYFKWVRAAQNYILAYRVTITPDPVKAGSRAIVTVCIPPDGYPDQGNIVNWIKARFPDTAVDAISVKVPLDLQNELDIRVTSHKRYGSSFLVDTPTQLEIELRWPTDYPVITQAFGANPHIYKKWGLPGHEGLDFRALTKTNIYACADGVVSEVENRANVHPYGRHIRIKHKKGYRTVYAHLYKSLVKVGDKVEEKQVIGKADSTGNSTGSHLHLTLKKDGATTRKETIYQGDVIDPTPFMVYP